MKAFKPLTLARWILPVCFVFLMSPLHSFAFGPSQSAPAVQQEQVVNLPSSTPSNASQSEPVKAQLVAEKKGIEPGKSFWVAIRLDMAPDWSTYWVNPGDIGMPTQVNWHLPAGFKAGPLKWPYPEKSITDGFVKYGYSGTTYLLAEITPPNDLPLNSTVDIKADVSWVACSDSCVPGKASLSLNLPVNKVESLNSNPQVAQAKDELPASSEDYQANVTASLKDKEIICNVAFSNTSGKVKEVTFYPAESSLINDAAQQTWKSNGKNLTLTLESPIDAPVQPDHLKGILLISSEHQGSLHEQAVEVNVPLAATASADSVASEVSSIGMALVFAFFGGLILNVMPCVLPVIALKIFSFVKLAQQRRVEILKHGGVFALGVLISFWVLSGFLLILRAYGEGIGWGFQLQEPMFVIVLTLVLFILGLSLLGVFELGSSLMGLGQRTKPSNSPLLGSFSSGVLATLVATPCTGPLLGPALGFAMTLSPIVALSVFTVMGLGMAFPYLLFSAFPSLVKFLPKPGNWMVTFKQIMGFLMMATVVWLLWVFGAQTDSLALIAVLGSLLVISIGAWVFGHWQLPTKRRWVRWTATSIAAALLAVGSFVSFTFAKLYKDTAPTELVQNVSQKVDSGQWEDFSAQRIDLLRKEGKPVFVDFTAKWCLICQANKVALNSEDVTRSFDKLGVVKMRADWTKNDPAITQELQKFGRTGVPLYVLYPADPTQKPYILPQTLTKSIVNEYLGKLHTDSRMEATVYAD